MAFRLPTVAACSLLAGAGGCLLFAEIWLVAAVREAFGASGFWWLALILPLFMVAFPLFVGYPAARAIPGLGSAGESRPLLLSLACLGIGCAEVVLGFIAWGITWVLPAAVHGGLH